jgi:phosphatidylglycerophosphate synthase
MGTWAIGAALAARPSWYAVAGASALMSWLAVAGRDRAALPANLVTTARVAAVAALPWCAGALPGWGVAAWAFGCFAADGLDGWLARRRAAATAFGAAFDQDTDAFFVMMLCLLLVARGSVPAWGLVAGLWRYAYVVLIRLVPARGEAPRSRIGRHVFALLVLCLVPGLAVPAAAPPLVAVGTALVTWSFGRSLMWSLRFAPG